MRRHASARHFRPDPIAPETLETIIDCAQRAPTSSNLQAYAVIAVSAADRRAELATLCSEQDQVREAPLFLVWCADLSRIDRASALRGHPHQHDYVENFLIATIDASLAAQNAALAAESLGLGVCYIGALRNNTRAVIRLLDLPHLMFPLFGMTLGVPARAPKPRPRLPMRSVLQHERYSAVGQDEALRDYDQAMIGTGIYDGRQVPVPGKPGEVEAYGWTEHTARRVARAARIDLKAVLEEQGFLLK
jgi:FMN reductase (NADPH)